MDGGGDGLDIVRLVPERQHATFVIVAKAGGWWQPGDEIGKSGQTRFDGRGKRRSGLACRSGAQQDEFGGEGPVCRGLLGTGAIGEKLLARLSLEGAACSVGCSPQ